jgi:peptidoglycan/LPS O-acetylase OafA/YrhL
MAALLVVWFHSAEIFVKFAGVAAHGTAWFDVAQFFNFGRAGVIAFFAISGYVIVPTVKGPVKAGARDFLIKRFFRLFPPFWVSMALASFTVWPVVHDGLGIGVVLANVTMIPLEFGQPMMMGHYWTLEVELIFYMAVLGLFWWGRLQRESTIAWILVILSIAWAVMTRNAKLLVDHNAVWPYLVYFLSVMFWGAMLRARYTQRRNIRSWLAMRRGDWPFIVVTVLVIGRPLLAVTFGSPHVHREDWRGTLVGLFLFLGATLVPEKIAKPFVWIGTISYSLYLLHPVVLYPIYTQMITHHTFIDEPLWMLVVAVMVLSMMLAAISYRLVEVPSNRLARRLVGRAPAPVPEVGGERADAENVRVGHNASDAAAYVDRSSKTRRLVGHARQQHASDDTPQRD